jgi:very-short-patch-repair endonuclease
LDSIRSSEPRRFLAERGGQLRGWLDTSISALAELRRAASEISSLLEMAAPRTLNECRTIARFALAAATDPRPTETWFDWTTINRILELAQEANDKSARLINLRDELSKDFAADLFRLPLLAWRTDFGNRYATIWRVFKPDYHRCRKQLHRTRTTSSRLTYVDAREKVAQGAEVLEIDDWFNTRREEHAQLLGFHYRGQGTKWEDVALHAETVRSILEVERGLGPPKRLKAALLNGGVALLRIGAVGKSLADNTRVLENSLRSIEECSDIRALTGSDAVDSCALDSLESRLTEARTWLNGYEDAIASVKSALRTGQSREVDAVAQDAAAAREAQEIERYFVETSSASQDAFCHFYSGLSTDWNHVLASLKWSEQFLAHLERQSWKSSCAEAACAPERIAGVRQLLPELESLVARLSAEKTFHEQVFGVATAVSTAGTTVDMAGFSVLATWLDFKIENIGKLSEWIQFREVREDCSAAGIDEFLARALEMNVPGDHLERALKKRLFAIQLDAVYEQLPKLRKFQWRDHEQLVREFQELDRQLMKTYASLIQAAVIDRQPTLDGPAVGQVGFLRRELAKQKKHAPLRKLFRESGTVILELTPCLLMSPLSVATFLPKDAIQFDLVIFDEASQVPSEEAIGAILRGRQLVVAGDAKQLPPTRFFERSASDDGDEDDENQAPLDSLLEDCDASGMQSCRLLWHYRSKHESLISFSNAEFYGDLITFPAPTSIAHVGIGVRLEHVADGVYDRGNSRTNRREAQEVARLVEQHCDHWGLKRSLGVIALSTAQEAAINEEVERLLLRRPDLEPLLQRTNEEPFFVKPLENVQGDERDSIIISICYGKDAAGNLSLNFGPINMQGGEKRLNVAITRARWELTIVSSILAHDIDEARTQSIGPKLLRRYLAFARDGRLPLGTAAPAGESESPFEHAVWDALRARGMEVDRQVGTSRYRIDLAIKDPQNPGRYILGVECDGATYHSSAVARDRDRLRQQILEGLGWTLHRIWSTDWIRDPKGCLLRLVQRIDELKTSPVSIPQAADVTTRIQNKTTEPQQAAEPIHPEDEPADPYDGHPEIDVFHETIPDLRRKEDFYSSGLLVEDDILRVVDRDGPIHEELLVRRVARTFQLMRAGHLVESRIISQIEAACRKGRLRRRGQFVWSQAKNGVTPRRPAPGAKLREIDHVPPEELEAAALLVVRLSRGITETELAAEAARVLGYSRISDHIRTATLNVARKLTSEGALELRGEQLFIAAPPVDEPPPARLESSMEDRVIVMCERCHAQLRLPKGRTGAVSCPVCSDIFRAQT